MAGAGQLARAGALVERDVDDGRERDAAGGRLHEPVQVVDHLGGSGALERVRAQRVADLAHRRGRIHPAPADVADHDPDAPVRQPEGVVPVAAGVVARVARHVAHDELEPGQIGERRRQQRALERFGDGVLAREQPRVVEREAGAAAELQRQLELARRVLAPGLGPHERHRAERAVAGDQRDHHRRVHLEFADEPALLVVQRRGLHQRRVDDRVQLRAAGADHVRRAGWGVRIRRVALLELARPADLVRVDVRHGGLLAGRELHRAPVGQPRDGELGDLLERVDRIHRRDQHLARGVQERVCLLAPAALGDVTEQPGDALGLPVRPADGPRACVQPALAAVGQRDPQVELVGGAVADRVLDQPAQRHAVIGMDDPLEEVVDARRLCAARESVERAHVV